jgi:hypothetical protein
MRSAVYSAYEPRPATLPTTAIDNAKTATVADTGEVDDTLEDGTTFAGRVPIRLTGIDAPDIALAHCQVLEFLDRARGLERTGTSEEVAVTPQPDYDDRPLVRRRRAIRERVGRAGCTAVGGKTREHSRLEDLGLPDDEPPGGRLGGELVLARRFECSEPPLGENGPFAQDAGVPGVPRIDDTPQQGKKEGAATR